MIRNPKGFRIFLSGAAPGDESGKKKNETDPEYSEANLNGAKRSGVLANFEAHVNDGRRERDAE
jgi:hypothetical protein